MLWMEKTFTICTPRFWLNSSCGVCRLATEADNHETKPFWRFLLPTLLFCGLLMFDYMYYDLIG